jgi:hypothetical protein
MVSFSTPNLWHSVATACQKKTLYLVAFNQCDLWGKANKADKLLVDIYEHWLDPAA